MKKSIGSFADAALSREQQRSVSGGLYSGSCRCGKGKGGFTVGNATPSDLQFFAEYYCRSSRTIICS
jgi:hypothetical protein